MVDLGGGQDGPIEHGFSNSVFILPGIIFVSLSAEMDVNAQIPDEPAVPNAPESFQMPSVEDLLKSLETMDNLSEEDKEELRRNLMGGINQEKGEFLRQVEAAKGLGTSYDFLVLFSLLAVVLLVFVFFGYKLYKSLAERERRKEEKRRQKQQKKKK